MPKVTIDLDEDSYDVLLEMQLELKKKKGDRTALNQVASDIVKQRLEEWKEFKEKISKND